MHAAGVELNPELVTLAARRHCHCACNCKKMRMTAHVMRAPVSINRLFYRDGVLVKSFFENDARTTTKTHLICALTMFAGRVFDRLPHFWRNDTRRCTARQIYYQCIRSRAGLLVATSQRPICRCRCVFDVLSAQAPVVRQLSHPVSLHAPTSMRLYTHVAAP